MAVRVGGSAGVSPSAVIGKDVGGIGLCGTVGSSSGSVEVGGGNTPGVRECFVSSQNTSILHARGSKLAPGDKSEESIATETCLILSDFFHIITHALSDTE